MRKSTRKGRRNPLSADSELSAIPAARLQAELGRRQRHVRTLMRRHERLLDSAHALKAEIAALGGSISGVTAKSPAAIGPRPRNKLNLVQALTRVLAHKPMRVAEAADAVLKAGYRTTSPSFRQIVNITLIRSGEFARVGRGQYRMK